MATSSSDFCESSDILHEYPCNACADDGKNIEGVNFCAECQTYFCQTCVQFHNKCFRTHTIFNKSVVKSGKLQYGQQQDGQACEKHAGNYVQMYCGEHDMVCCAVCIAVDHRLCKSADFIPKLSKEILGGRDRKKVKTSLEGTLKRLQAMKARKLKQVKEVGKEKDGNLKEIVKMNEDVIARVKEIERNSVEQVQEKHDRIVDTIKTDIECIDVKLNDIESSIEKINTFKGNNEAKLFVVLNKAHEVDIGSSSFIDKNGNRKYGNIEFEINPCISSFLSKVDAFGNVKGDSRPATGNVMATHSQLSEASFVKEVSVRGHDSCVLDNGQIIIAANVSLVRLNENYELLDESSLRNPGCLCKVGPTKIAVLVGNEVKFVDAGKSLITQSFSFSVKDEYFPVIKGKTLCVQCSGMSFSNEKLFVCVELTYTWYGNSRPWQNLYRYGVSVYDLKGSHIETCIFPTDDLDIGFIHATYSSYDSSIYLSTSERGLLVYDMTNKKLKEMTHKSLMNPQHVCEGMNGQLFVSGRDSHNVFLVDRENDTMEEILGSIDGIWQPERVMYVEQQNCLIVTDKSGSKVYQLK